MTTAPTWDINPATLPLVEDDPVMTVDAGAFTMAAYEDDGYPLPVFVDTPAGGAIRLPGMWSSMSETPGTYARPTEFALALAVTVSPVTLGWRPTILRWGRTDVRASDTGFETAGWWWPDLAMEAGATPGLTHVVGLISDETSARLYVDGVLADTTDPAAVEAGAFPFLLSAGERTVTIHRVQGWDEPPSDFEDILTDLGAQYLSGVALSAHGSWSVTGSAALADLEEDDPWEEPDIPEPDSGGSVTPPDPPEAQLPPAGVPDPVIRYVSEVMPAPSLDARGRPVDWEPSTVSSQDWGRLQVAIEGEDVTYLLGAPTPFPTITEVEPFGWASASIRLPQLTVFHSLGSGSLSWCRQGANVRIRVKRIAGGYVDLFRGFVEAPASVSSAGVRLECTGLLFQGDLEPRTPALTSTPRDAGREIATLLNSVPGRRYTRMTPVTTGLRTTVAGSWEPRLTGGVQQILATMLDKRGRQWTVMPDGREPVLRRKNRTAIAWTVRAGQRGIEVALDQELRPNVIFGEGVRPDGGRWRNAKYPNWRPDDTPDYPLNPNQAIALGTTDAATSSGTGVSDWQAKAGQPVTGVYSAADRQACRDLQADAGIQVDGRVGPQTWAATFGTGSNTGTLDGAFIAPLVAARKVTPRLLGPDGDDLGPNPAYDEDVIRVADVISFGQGVKKSEGRSWARRRMARDVPEGMSKKSLHGTVRFELDPTEGHRLEVVRAGSNGVINGYQGQDVRVHVSHVQISQGSHGGIVVAATVDTEARDYPTLDAIRTRERNAVDPAKAFIKRRRGDDMSDRATFDAESPAGRIPRHALFENLWTVIRVPFGDYGTIVRTSVRTSEDAARFALAVFSREVTAADIVGVVGNPLIAESNPWSEHADALEGLGLLQAWGWAKQPAGHYPLTYSTPDGEDDATPVTGRLLDDATWQYASQSSPWLWVATVADRGCYVQGRFWPGVD